MLQMIIKMMLQRAAFKEDPQHLFINSICILLLFCYMISMQKHEQNIFSEGQLEHKSLHKISNGIKSSTHLTPKIYSEEYNAPAQNTVMNLCVPSNAR
jgi:hypothetical protein